MPTITTKMVIKILIMDKTITIGMTDVAAITRTEVQEVKIPITEILEVTIGIIIITTERIQYNQRNMNSNNKITMKTEDNNHKITMNTEDNSHKITMKTMVKARIF